MQNPILKFAEFFRSKLLDVPELQSLVANRIYNSAAPPKAVFPHAIFTVIPLQENVGQARRSIQTRLLCDFKIHYRLPLDPLIGDAVEAAKDKFRTAKTAHSFGEFRLSVWCERPISMLASGAAATEKIYALGETFKATMSRVETLQLQLIPFRSRNDSAENFALSSNGRIPFSARAGDADNIALFSGKISFMNRSGQIRLIELV